MVQAPGARRGGLRIAVRDTGIGIAKDKIPALFDAFTQADQSTTRRFGGTGLGLAICRRLAEAMGGKLTASSESGPGLGVRARPADEGAGAVAGLAVPRRRDARSSASPAPATRGRPASLPALRRPDGGRARARRSTPGLVIADAAALTRRAAQPGAGGLHRRIRRERAAGAAATPAWSTWCWSSPCAGATWPPRWPARRPARRSARRSAEASRAESEALPSFAGRRLLVADDSAVNREVAHGGPVPARLPRHPGQRRPRRPSRRSPPSSFDLMLMDASMPEMDGYEADQRHPQGRGRTPASERLPIVALTAHVVGSSADRWREAGMDGMLPKPFTLAALAAKLADFLPPSVEVAPETVPAPAAEPRQPAAAMPAQSAAELLDPQVTGELARLAASGKSDFVARVRRLYRENAPEAVKQLIAACVAGDVDGAARAAHALKSMSLNMGARVVAETAARLEAQARDLQVVNVDQAQVLHRQLLATLDVLEGYPPDLRATAASGAPPDEEALLADLAEAIDNDQLTLVYQPQFDREGETITGIETLVRWTHPVRGFVSPAFFIPIAERYGMIGRVTHWVLNRAMTETRDLGDFTISFNASAVEFADPVVRRRAVGADRPLRLLSAPAGDRGHRDRGAGRGGRGAPQHGPPARDRPEDRPRRLRRRLLRRSATCGCSRSTS